MRFAILGAVMAAAVACEKDRASSTAPSGPIPATTVIPVTFAENSGVTKDVRAECELETKIPEWVAENAPGATPGPAGASGRVLTMEITQLMGTEGASLVQPIDFMVTIVIESLMAEPLTLLFWVIALFQAVAIPYRALRPTD